MAVAPTIPIVSAGEYLNSGYHPDMEYVEGVLVERDVPTIAHSLLQLILGEYFRRYRKQFRFAALSDARTQIVERARYRIPDRSEEHTSELQSPMYPLFPYTTPSDLLSSASIFAGTASSSDLQRFRMLAPRSSSGLGIASRTDRKSTRLNSSHRCIPSFPTRRLPISYPRRVFSQVPQAVPICSAFGCSHPDRRAGSVSHPGPDAMSRTSSARQDRKLDPLGRH